MPHVIKLKDGTLITPFGVSDVLETVENYVGCEVREYLEEYLAEAAQDCSDYEGQIKEYEKDTEKLQEHQREVLENIQEELEALDILLHGDRLNRKRMQGAVRILRQMVSREL